MTHSSIMLIIFIRAIILLFTLIVVMRLMGKRQIGEMQPYEFVITLLIAELACTPMSDVSIPLIYGVVSVLAIFIVHQFLTVLERISNPIRRLVCGKPSMVINKEGVDVLELRRNNLDVEDLIESLRGSGNFSLDSVSYAIYESNGKLSVLKNNDTENNNELPVLIISEGKLSVKNLELCHLTKEFVDEILKSQNITSLKNIEVMTIDGAGKIYLKENGKRFKTASVGLTEASNRW